MLVRNDLARALCLAVSLVLWLTHPAGAQQGQPAAVTYTISIPRPQHRWLEVEAVFFDLGDRPALLQMSTASPGRYARHEFAKNIFGLELRDGMGRQVTFTRPKSSQWRIATHDGTLRVRYRIFGDRVDGTYLAVDPTHAHINMPATLMWVHGLEDRPVRVAFEPPRGASWTAATQLFPTDERWIFTAPNLHYLMDSPAELSDLELRTFEVSDPTRPTYRPVFRVAVHHLGRASDVDRFATDIEAIVRETVAVFGEFPSFEGGRYTFIADYLPGASGDAMEHRNSTVLTAPARLDQPGHRLQVLGSAAHELVHAWNAERIRPRSLEPFDFTDANVSGELWLVEGFTNYYGGLIPVRAGLFPIDSLLSRWSSVLNTVHASPGRQIHTPVQMSRLAPFTDAATAIDPTNWDNTFISYYTWGEAIALGLDLSLRERSEGRIGLDDYMRAMWRRFGAPSGAAPGLVATPYTPEEARGVLGDLTDTSFAHEFFTRFIDGHEVPDYTGLVRAAGLRVIRRAPDEVWLGDVAFGPDMRITRLTPYGSPLHEAGLDRDDVVESADGHPVTTESALRQVIRSKQPGDDLPMTFRRHGRTLEVTVTLATRPHVELVTRESLGESLTSQQREFRNAWLGSTQQR